MKISILILLFAPIILFGCATTADVQNIQVQIKDVKQDVRELFKETTKAKYAAKRAKIQADKALEAAQKVKKTVDSYITTQVTN